jgi:hypothetical protein
LSTTDSQVLFGTLSCRRPEWYFQNTSWMHRQIHRVLTRL